MKDHEKVLIVLVVFYFIIKLAEWIMGLKWYILGGISLILVWKVYQYFMKMIRDYQLRRAQVNLSKVEKQKLKAKREVIQNESKSKIN